MMRYFLLTIFLFIFSGCTTTSETPTGGGNVIPDNKISSSKAEEPAIEDNILNIALLIPTSNKKDSNYMSLVNSAQMAMMDANNANINIIPIDSEMINNDPQKLVTQLTEDRVKVIIGPVYAQETETLVGLLKEIKDEMEEIEKLLKKLLITMSVRDAVEIVSSQFDVPKKQIYKLAVTQI